MNIYAKTGGFEGFFCGSFSKKSGLLEMDTGMGPGD